MFEAVTLWSGGDILPLDEGFLLIVQEFFDALVVLIEPVLMDFLLWPNGQLGRLSHQSLELFPLLGGGGGGVQTVVRGQLACRLGPPQTCDCVPAASVLQCQKLACRISQSCDVSE